MKFAVVAALAMAICHASAVPIMSVGLLSKLRDEGAADVVIVLKDEVAPVVNSINSKRFVNSASKTTAMVQELKQFTKKAQQPILAYLQKSKVSGGIKTFWITNRIFVPKASLELIEGVSSTFSAQIAEIREPVVAHIDYTVDSTDSNPQAVEWGVNNINAPAVWEDGYLGQGVIVGHIDSGVRATHESLAGAIRDTHAWFDPYSLSNSPIDEHGHGTHTIGSILGRGGIGVAPNATYITCRGCDTSACGETALLDCGQFITCPTQPDGTGEDCSKKPHLSSNSWGGTPEATWYNDVISAWRAADIVPIFAIGNNGPGCRTAGGPGDQENLISVGATTALNAVASFSSHGPSLINTRIKPEVSAPGANIKSASHTGDSAYATASGTSMATPHVAGTVALLLSKNKQLSFTQIDTLLKENNIRPRLNQVICTGGGVNVTYPWPNNSFGHGKIDAKLAVDAAPSA